MTAETRETAGGPAHELIGAREAARLLGVSPRTLWSLAQCGDVPSVRFPGRRIVRYDRVDLAEWIQRHKSRR